MRQMNRVLTRESVIPRELVELIGMVKSSRDFLEEHIQNIKSGQCAGNLIWQQISSVGDVQILLVCATEDSDSYMQEHIHKESVEFFCIIKGNLEINGVVYGPHETAVIEAGDPHKVRAVGADLYAVCVLYPPEEAYSGSKE